MEHGLDKASDLEFLVNHNLIAPKVNSLIDLLFQLDLKWLKTLGVINSKDELFSELLKYKVENFEIPNLQNILPNLTDKERKVFSYLFINKNKLVSTDKLDFMFRLIDDKYSLWASYKAINRLRKKVEGKFELRNVKGKGYVLTESIN